MSKAEEKRESEALEKVLKNLEKYGNVVKSGRDVLNKKYEVISVSPNLDMYLGGGVPEGCFWVVSGHPKVGKTTSILSFCAEAQKLGKHIYYLDIEHRLKKMNLDGIKGLKVDKEHFTVVQSEQGNILTAEMFLTIAEEIIKDHIGCVVVFDSASALCAEKEYLDDITGQTRSLGPKLLATFCRRTSGLISVNKTILIMVQHLITNTSGWGAPFNEDGGVKVKFAMDIKMRAKKTEDLTSGSGENERNVGLKVTWDILCTALGKPPVDKVESCIRFGIGIDKAFETMEAAFDLGFIKKDKKSKKDKDDPDSKDEKEKKGGGGWITFKDKKYNGKENLYQYLISKEGEADLAELQGLVSGLLNPTQATVIVDES